jgi:signal transduction histidine kinase
MRLSLLYAGLFLLSGTCVLAIVYLADARSSATIVVATRPPGAVRDSSLPHSVKVVPPVPGAPVAPPAGRQVRELVSDQHAADLSDLLEVSWLALAVTTVASALFGWIAAGRVLRPLRTITMTARTISAGNLHQRLALAGPDDEFKQLGDTLDDLLGRLEASFEAQRRFVANASHELRTPLTLERTLLQVALADPNATVDDLRSTCEELLASGMEHERLLEALLTLASSERGIDHRERSNLSAVTELVLLTPRPDTERLGLQVETNLASAPIFGDPSLLERLVANLIDNAVRYNVPGGRVELSTTTDAGRSILSVANTGPLIAPEDIDRLFEPFQQIGAERTGAGENRHGLGLSIVRAIAVAHDAEITARPRPEGGLAVTISFPLAAGD